MGYHIQLYRMARRLVALAMAILLSPWGLGQPLAAPAVLDVAAVPQLGAEGRADYARFLLQATPRAFALAPDGNWAWASAIGTPAETTARALSLCADYAGQACALYAQDLDVVWPGRESHPAPAPTLPLLAGTMALVSAGFSMRPVRRGGVAVCK